MYKLTINGKNFYSDVVLLFVGYFVDEALCRRTATELNDIYMKGEYPETEVCIEKFEEIERLDIPPCC